MTETPPDARTIPSHEPIERLLAEVRLLAAAGHSGVSLARLEAFVLSLAQGPTERDVEIWRTQVSLDHAGDLEMFKSVLEAGQTTIKTLLAINGGAAVALLAFLGNLLGKAPAPGTAFPVHDLAVSMACFVGGVACAGFSAAARYVVQWLGHLHNIRRVAGARTSGWRKAATVFQILSVACGTASLALFLAGGRQAFLALK